jgi:hypothetical protein
MAIVISIGAVLVSMISAGFAWMQLRQAKRASEVPAITGLFAEYRSPEMVAARKLLYAQLPGTEACPLHDLPPPLAEAAELVAHYLDHLGVLVRFRLLKPKVVSGFILLSAKHVWDELVTYVDLEREKRDGGLYLNHFEHLVAVMSDFDPNSVRNELRTVPRPRKSATAVARIDGRGAA